jgi:hypothetical protein
MGLARCGCSRAVCTLFEVQGSGMNAQVVRERAERVVPNWSQGILAGPKLSRKRRRRNRHSLSANLLELRRMPSQPGRRGRVTSWSSIGTTLKSGCLATALSSSAKTVPTSVGRFPWASSTGRRTNPPSGRGYPCGLSTPPRAPPGLIRRVLPQGPCRELFIGVARSGWVSLIRR